MHTTCILHAYYMHTHAYYIHTTCILHAYYMHTTCILHAYFSLAKFKRHKSMLPVVIVLRKTNAINI